MRAFIDCGSVGWMWGPRMYMSVRLCVMLVLRVHRLLFEAVFLSSGTPDILSYILLLLLLW